MGSFMGFWSLGSQKIGSAVICWMMFWSVKPTGWGFWWKCWWSFPPLLQLMDSNKWAAKNETSGGCLFCFFGCFYQTKVYGCKQMLRRRCFGWFCAYSSSLNHVSVPKWDVSNTRLLSLFGFFFHWTMIMGERVQFLFFLVLISFRRNMTLPPQQGDFLRS